MLQAGWFAAVLAVATPLCQASSLPAISAGISASLAAVAGNSADSSQSSGNAIKNAEGEYRVLAVADAADRPGWARVELAPLAAGRTALYLYVEADDLASERIAAGQIVAARAQAYGLAFARQGRETAFAVVLRDDWLNDIHPRPVAI
jgi:hypothetical protein